MKNSDQRVEELLEGRVLARVQAKEMADVYGGAKSVSCGSGCDEIVSDGTSPLSDAATSESLPDPFNQVP